MGSSSLTRDRTQPPCIMSTVLATGPLGKSPWNSFQRSFDHNIRIYFWALYSVPLDYGSVFYASTSFYYCGFVNILFHNKKICTLPSELKFAIKKINSDRSWRSFYGNTHCVTSFFLTPINFTILRHKQFNSILTPTSFFFFILIILTPTS